MLKDDKYKYYAQEYFKNIDSKYEQSFCAKSS